MKRRVLAILLALGLLVGIPASAQVPISGLGSVGTAGPSDLAVIVHSGTTMKATLSQIWSGGGDFYSETVISSSGNYTTPSDSTTSTWYRYRMAGGGGGGGGAGARSRQVRHLAHHGRKGAYCLFVCLFVGFFFFFELEAAKFDE